ncbi:MAG: radical SAM protein [bacterium]
MSILLCQPISTEQSPQKNPPLGILFSGAAAELSGYEVHYWDERWDSEESLLRKMEQAQIVGVSSFTGIQLKYARRILMMAKEKGKITLFGGIHANLTPDQSLQEPFIDYVAAGEGEITLLSFMDFIGGKIANPIGIKGEGINYIPAGKVLTDNFISPINEKTLRYFKLANETNDIMLPSSRGCPYGCGFCVNSTVKEKKYRMVDITTWTSWLDQLRSHMDIKWLQIGDDYLGSQRRIIEIGEILKARGIKWHPSFRADNFNQSGDFFAQKLKDLGVTDIAIGVETGSARLMDFIDKAETKEEIVHAARCLSAVGIRPRYYFIIGFPTETAEERLETYDFADCLYKIHQADCNIVFYNFTPFPGIALYESAIKNGMEVPKSLGEWEQFTICNSGSKELQNVYYIAGFHFHQQPGSKTDLNFPGSRRLLIRPFERICDLRWRLRYFKNFAMEKAAIEFLLRHFRKK